MSPRSDVDAVEARLYRALSDTADRAASHPQARPVQPFGQALSGPAYDAWRERVLAVVQDAMLPELRPGTYALVLWTIHPEALGVALGERRLTRLVSPPSVGVFNVSLRPHVALADMLSGWLETAPLRRLGPLAVAPPVLELSSGPVRRRFLLTVAGEQYTLPAPDFSQPPSRDVRPPVDEQIRVGWRTPAGVA